MTRRRLFDGTHLGLRIAFGGFVLGLIGAAGGFAGFQVGARWLAVAGVGVTALAGLVAAAGILWGWFGLWRGR